MSRDGKRTFWNTHRPFLTRLGRPEAAGTDPILPVRKEICMPQVSPLSVLPLAGMREWDASQHKTATSAVKGLQIGKSCFWECIPSRKYDHRRRRILQK